ncbi:MAG TPA: hypothetical protein VMK12_00120 [Anaeromyxobacteraceae bacterium]|nr:hypothetical protein [Anaeromyxobacteraceae bacterium]
MNCDIDALLSMLRDPNRETQEIAAAANSSREDAGRASRFVLGIGKAKAEEVLTLPPPLARAVLRAAASAQRVDLLVALVNHPSKEVVKDAKRALYQLKLRGVSTPEPPRPRPAPAPPSSDPAVPCYASIMDGQGERILWIGRTVPGKGIEAAQALISDQRGFIELHLSTLSRREYRSYGKDLLERGSAVGVIEVEQGHARGLAEAARVLNEKTGNPLPQGTDAFLSRLAGAPSQETTFAPLSEDEERAAIEASGRLHELPLVRSWVAEEDAVRDPAKRLYELTQSSLCPDEQARANAVVEIIAQAVDGYFDEPHRALWASRLLALAEHLRRGGETELPPLALAAARALRDGVEAWRIPFASLLVQKALFGPPEPSSQPADESPLILHPGRSP